jgi:hypothetical protein
MPFFAIPDLTHVPIDKHTPFKPIFIRYQYVADTDVTMKETLEIGILVSYTS